MYAIETLNLTKKYKNQRGAENMSLTIEQGEIFGLLGPNGCGKTTIMKMLVGLIHADSGEFRIFEKKPDEEISIMSQVGYRQSGGTILISSHISDEIQRICTRAAVMTDGKIIHKSSIYDDIMEYGSVEGYYLHIVNEKEEAE